MENAIGMRGRCWAEIDLDCLKRNYRLVRSAVAEHVKVCCVVKANAYGHGAVALAHLYQRLGADYLAVSNVEEALQLRKNDVTLPILILSYTPPECAKMLSEQSLTQCVYSYEYGKRLEQELTACGARLRIHIKLDTGMGRIGFACRGSENIAELEQAAELCHSACFIPEGVFTHFSVSDEGEDGEAFTEEQLTCFEEGIALLRERGIEFSIRHCANSAAIFDYPRTHMDMVRAGIVLYGLRPSRNVKKEIPLSPAMTLKTVIARISELRVGESVGYGQTFRADKRRTIGTLPVGYADGFRRENGNGRYSVCVGADRAPIVGRICMDQCMIDLDGIVAKVGDTVVLFGNEEGCTAEDLAALNRTISYETVCDVGARVPRAYVEQGQIRFWCDQIFDADL